MYQIINLSRSLTCSESAAGQEGGVNGGTALTAGRPAFPTKLLNTHRQGYPLGWSFVALRLLVLIGVFRVEAFFLI